MSHVTAQRPTSPNSPMVTGQALGKQSRHHCLRPLFLSSSRILFSLITFKNTLSSVALSTVNSMPKSLLPFVVRTSNNRANDIIPVLDESDFIGTSNRVATSSAIRDPGITAMKSWILTNSSRVRQLKCTSYIAYRADNDSIDPMAVD